MTGVWAASFRTPQIIVAFVVAVVISNVSFGSTASAQLDIGALKQKVVVIERARGGGLPPEIGAGFFVTSSGYILTASHVLLNSDEPDDVLRTRTVRIRLKDGSRYTGRILFLNRIVDLALLKIKPDQSTPYLSLGNSETVQVGASLTMVGHPLGGAQWEVSSGDVEKITPIEHIHVRATLGPGYSGGPAVNSDGLVVGVVSYRAEGGEQSYLVPIDDARVLLAGIITPATVAGTLPVGRLVSPQLGANEYQFQNNLLRATVTSAGKDKEGKNLTISIRLENISDVNVKLRLPKRGATAIDDQGGTYNLTSINGVARCTYDNRDFCSDEKKFSTFTTKSRTTLVFSFHSNTGSTGEYVSFSADFFGYVGGKPQDMSVGISNIKLSQK